MFMIKMLPKSISLKYITQKDTRIHIYELMNNTFMP